MTAAKPPPTRIKLYGVFPVTRRGYYVQLFLALMLLAALLVIRMIVVIRLAPHLQELARGDDNKIAFAIWLLRYLHWLVVAFVILFGIEAFFVLRRFRRLEAASPPSAPSN